jgi:general secretion pathway protein K
MNKYTIPQSVRRQRGVALIVALLVVALAVILIAGLLDRGELTAARTRNQLRLAQAQAYAQGLETYAARVLQQDLNSGSSADTAGDMWAVPLPPTPVPGGDISATMSDLDGRFNLNNLDPTYDTAGKWKEKFGYLLTALKLDPNLADVVHDWMSTAAGNATTDQYYLGQLVPYRSAKHEFMHISELRLLKGIDGDVYAKLAPYVTALPAGTQINVNTAGVPVLMTLYAGMTQQTAQSLWQQGHANFKGLEDLKSMAPGVQIDCAPNIVCYGVASEYFLARGEITLDGLPFVFNSVIHRSNGPNGGGISVIQRSRGADG